MSDTAAAAEVPSVIDMLVSCDLVSCGWLCTDYEPDPDVWIGAAVGVDYFLAPLEDISIDF